MVSTGWDIWEQHHIYLTLFPFSFLFYGVFTYSTLHIWILSLNLVVSHLFLCGLWLTLHQGVLVAPTLSIGSILLQQAAITASFHYSNVEIVESRANAKVRFLFMCIVVTMLSFCIFFCMGGKTKLMSNEECLLFVKWVKNKKMKLSSRYKKVK